MKARAGLDPARAAIARLDRHFSPEDKAADLIEAWQSSESSLRLLVGTTTLTGQPLIREARLRQLLNFEQANALAEFSAVNDRLQSVGYVPTEADLASGRAAVQKLDAALTEDAAATQQLRPPPSAPPISGQPVRTTPAIGTPKAGPEDVFDQIKVVPPPRRFEPWMLITLGVILLAALGVGGYFAFRPKKSNSLEHGIEAYRAGQREVAVSDFSRATREDPSDPLPHIYLARMAREVGNYTLATQELTLALQADPQNAIALREMGANMLSQGKYDLAVNFYRRAVEIDPTDKTALGYLGCSLMRLNRVQLATNFLNRAGPGPWSNCTPASPQSGTPTTIPR